MGLNLATLLAGEGITVNIVRYKSSTDSLMRLIYAHNSIGFASDDRPDWNDPWTKIHVSPAGFAARLSHTFSNHERKNRTWEKGTDLDALKAEDPGLGIAASVPVHRLGIPSEVSGVVVM